MFRVALQFPRLAAWHNRLSRVPRWGWIAFALGAGVPIALLLVAVFTLALLSGLAVVVLVLVILAARRLGRNLAARFRDDGRRNVRVLYRPRDETIFFR